jgi:2-oxo-4-hydroxy-4-carboxy-5-ureidoimidazoline decarboxylase
LSDGLERFNALPRPEAEDRLYACLAHRPWASRVAARRPYATVDLLLAEAEAASLELTRDDWLAAFAAHPRIGEGGGHSPGSSEREQSRVMRGPEATRAALAEENRLYESRFGHVFLIFASGRSAAEILEELRRRMRNDPSHELEVAAGEHRKITRLRLERLLSR